MRSLGTSSSGAVLGMILTANVTVFHGTLVHTESAFRTVFLSASAVSLLATMTALLLPQRGRTQ